MAASRAVPLLPPASRILLGDVNPAMTHPRFADRRLALLLVILVVALPASAEWKEKVLYSFQGGTTDGSLPAGGVVFDSQGNLYGATSHGGPESCTPIGSACGMAFELTPPTQKGGAWSETLIYQFQGEGSKDASVPTGGLIIDSAGNLYGVTGYGGTGDCFLLGVKGGCGTVFELSPPPQKGGVWTETILYSFQGGNDGYFPWGTLIFDREGNLYGATNFGGGGGTTCNIIYGGQCGTVFRLSPPTRRGGTWTEKVLHRFAGVSSSHQTGDGANPNGGLVLDGKGTIYGMTHYGGYNCPHNSNQGCGTVFELTPPKEKADIWTEKLIHVFKDGDDGAEPNAGLLLDTDGSLYGAAGGGAEKGGIVFRLSSTANGRWKETAMYEFANNGYGYGPSVSLFDSAGNLYGTTLTAPIDGSIFRLTPKLRKDELWTLNFLHEFVGSPDGTDPSSYLIWDKEGDLYGAAQYGGTGTGCDAGCGMVFELKR
jgi:hypothetical protein